MLSYMAERHNLSDINPITKTGTCSICGPNSKLKPKIKNGQRVYRCYNKWHSEPSAIRRNNKRVGQPYSQRRYRVYGITEDDYNWLLFKQNEHCALCPQASDLHIDHDHNTGYIRGLLCGPCNRALGILGDTIESIEAVLKYLKENA